MTTRSSTSAPAFEPCHAAHAIAEMSVFFEFAPPPSPAGTLSLPQTPSPSSFEGEFQIEPDQVQHVQVGPNSSAISFAAAYTLRKGANPSTPDWQIRIEPLGFSVHCLNYTRWNQVWPETRRHLARLVAGIDASASPPVSVGLRYLDQFFFSGTAEAYDAAILLRKSSHIHPRAFTSGPRWHCHTGWFDGSGPESEVLNQLNLASVVPVEGAPGPGKIMIAIEHAQVLRPAANVDLTQYLRLDDNQGTPLDKLMQRLHDSNRTVMNELLQPGVTKRINLQKGPRS